ncbi:hypothetical protein KIF24_31325 [Micromonospora sp. Llam7]|uniref:TfuA-like protein n=1 Tax=Micromonospora tarapacensis TaxID=2835305 RepID=UPI001C83CB39|nr:TfuA-like protein [Micromonospora tarapacensis]MBX7270073.1 hypothetical protein [Micromonospora tarapacensis]
MSVHVFAGPTIDAATIGERLPEAVVHPPVRHGDLLALGLVPGDTVAIIDGVFFRTGAIRHKEILHLLQSGVTVWGASSMGALRAAELDRYGMRGVGVVHRLYRTGVIDGDDEVALLHAEADDGYRVMSEALVSVRVATRRARVAGVVTAADEKHLCAVAKSLAFGDRTYRRITAAAAADGLPTSTAKDFRDFVAGRDTDVKRRDALALLARLAASPRDSGPPLPDGQPMPMTSFLLRWMRSAPVASVLDTGVSDLATLTAVQLFAEDYPALHRRLILGELLRCTAPPNGPKPITPGEDDQSRLTERALDAARRRGLIPHLVTEVPTAFRHWLAPEELSLPPDEALTRAMVRSFRWSPNVRVVEPIVEALAGTEAWHRARELVARAHQCNARLAELRPTFNAHYIADAKIRGWVAHRWGVTDPTTAMLDRGFGGQPDLRARATMFLPLDRMEPIAPLVIGGVKAPAVAGGRSA